ncbi:MAG: hypothetical protein IKV68_01770 [Oscillospiraceae bacterium]|nr:hypothetical protein [Oscillospiraceae bacterium]
MQHEPKIAVLRWEVGHVPEGLMQLETMPGNSTNLDSYPFPVKLVEVPGANANTVIINPDPKVLENMIAITRRLAEEDGIRAVTTSCGFNAVFQTALAEAVDIPVFTSSLLQVPFVSYMIGKNRTVAVITANKSSLSPAHMHACGITDEMNVKVFGLEEAKEFRKIFDQPDVKFDMDGVSEEIMGVARRAVAENPEIGAIVLECTDLPPFAARMREELDLPVFDINSLVGHVAMSLSELRLY